MFLKKFKRKDGRIYLTIAENKYIDGKSKSFHLETIGYVDELVGPNCPDPIGFWTKEVKRRNEEAKAASAPIVIEFSSAKKIDKRCTHTLEVGAAITDRYFFCDLGIWDFFEKKRTARKFEFDPCRILEFLIFDRIIHPSSKKGAFERRGVFPRKCDFSLGDIYRALGYINEQADELIDAMNERLAEVWGPRNRRHLYYDVTNYYFEVENEDESGIRRRGVSKEHRPNPIVQMGLLLDQSGIPLNFEIFPGNVNDMSTLLPVMKKAGLRDNTSRVVMVADKGLNTSSNIAATLLDGNGFIFSQSVRRATKELKDWVLDDADYEVNADHTFKIKSRIDQKEISVEREGGSIHKEKITVKEVAFWSKDYFERSRYERTKVIEKSLRAIERGDVATAHLRSQARYVKEMPFDKQTGEIASINYSLDHKRIDEDEAMDGYYCIITSEVDMADHDVIDAYRGLWRIEDSFRVIKGEFNARPVYLSREDHIRAHFLICYIALTIMRLIQLDTKGKYTTRQIAEAIGGLIGHNLDKNLYFFDYRTDVTDDLCKAVGIDLTRQVMTKGEITHVMATVRKPETNPKIRKIPTVKKS